MARVRRYLYDIFSSGRFVLAEMEDDTLWYLGLREWGQVPEAPPNAHEYSILRRGWGRWIDDSKRETDCDPSREHLGAALRAGYCSSLETVYVLDNGAAIRFFPQRFTADASAQQYRIHYLSPMSARALRLGEEDLSLREDFSPVASVSGATSHLYPMEGAYIVRPGLDDLPCPIENALRVDFVQLYESMLRPTCEGEVFRAVASQLAEGLKAAYDAEPQVPYSDEEPGVCIFRRGQEIVAALMSHQLPWGEEPYHDCNVLQLCYRAADSAAVEALLQRLQAQHSTVQLREVQ